MKTSLGLGLLVVANTLVLSSAQAEICQMNVDPKVMQTAYELILNSESPGSPIVLAANPAISGAPRFKPYEFEIRDLRVQNGAAGRGPYFLLATLTDSGAKIKIDLGITYYFDQSTGKYMNLALASKCQLPELVQVVPSIRFLE